MSVWSYGADTSSLGRHPDVTEAAQVTDSALAIIDHPPRLLRSIAPKSFVRLAAGSAHALAVTSNGMVYAWGWNGHGQLGLGTEAVGTTVQLPRPISFLATRQAGTIACGAAHSAVLVLPDADGGGAGAQCFTFGANAAGQLARAVDITNASPRPAQLAARLMTVDPSASTAAAAGADAGADAEAGGRAPPQPLACGAGHCAVLTAEGGVWTWGSNQHGQCGQQRTGGCATANAVHALSTLKGVQLACGAAHTLVLTTQGRVYAFGLNATGQLGDGGCSRQPCPSPVLAKMPPAPVVQLACGEEFSCAVTADGRLLTWGFGGCGQLGHGSALSLKVPREVACERVEQVACGMGHVLARTKAGGLLRWGVEAPWEVLQHELARMPEEDREEVMSVCSVPKKVDLSAPAPRDAQQLAPVRCAYVAAGRHFSVFVGEPVPLMESSDAALLIQNFSRQQAAKREAQERALRAKAAKTLGVAGTQWVARKTLKAAQENLEAREKEKAAMRMQAIARGRKERSSLDQKRQQPAVPAEAAAPPPREKRPAPRPSRTGGGYAPPSGGGGGPRGTAQPRRPHAPPGAPPAPRRGRP